ncbi:MAG TPA: hypothetical protein VEQ59_07915 [Polyangiaceae bacterium]|nr:hypothetical protein [Polyangiaceae bacterium]
MPNDDNSERNVTSAETVDDVTKRKAWVAFYTAVGLLVVLGVALGLGQHTESGEALPAPPANAR